MLEKICKKCGVRFLIVAHYDNPAYEVCIDCAAAEARARQEARDPYGTEELG
jgi:hypothetical protein